MFKHKGKKKTKLSKSSNCRFTLSQKSYKYCFTNVLILISGDFKGSKIVIHLVWHSIHENKYSAWREVEKYILHTYNKKRVRT